MTRVELLAALAAAGYSGPTSYSKSRLEELLQEQTGTLPDPTTERFVADDSGELPALPTGQWRGLVGPTFDEEGGRVNGSIIRVEGIARKRFEFISFNDHPVEPYVTVRGPFPGYGTNRYIDPSRIRDKRGRELKE